MAAATSTPPRNTSPGAAVGFVAVALGAFAWLALMFMAYNDPGVRQMGFNSAGMLANYSWLVFALLGAIMLAIRMRLPTAEGGAPGAGGGAIVGVPGGALIPSAGQTRPRVSAEDPASRPGAPPSTSIPRVQAEHLTEGWKRFRFPAERTGGLYVDTDIIVDSGPQFSDSKDAPRGKMILRVRDEVARLCVRCDLIEHCHSKVQALVTIDDMRGNSDCVPGLKRIATAKLEAIKRPPPAPAPEPEPAPAPTESAPAGDPT